MPRTHQEIDARSLALHRLVAEKLRRDPALLDVARANLARWRQTLGPNARRYLDAWDRVLDGGVEQVIAISTEDSERAAALRQSSPFAGVISPSERHQFLRAWRARHASVPA